MIKFGAILVLFFISSGSCKPNNRIVGGEKADITLFPYQCSLQRPWNSHFCGGTIIDRKVILTAAHCCKYSWGGVLSPFDVKIMAGQQELKRKSNTVYRNVAEVIIHPEYDDNTMANDACILTLKEPLPYDNPNISVAAIKTTCDIETGTTALVSGWGAQNHSNLVVSPTLMYAPLQILNKSECAVKYSYAGVNLAESMMCAAVPDGSKDACQGDSGGPLFCQGYLIGVTSTGIGCADVRYPGIFTNTCKIFPWIYPILMRNRINYPYY